MADIPREQSPATGQHDNPAIRLFAQRLYSGPQGPARGDQSPGTGSSGSRHPAGFLELTADIFPAVRDSQPAPPGRPPFSPERETDRARRYEDEFKRRQDLGQAALIWAAMPQRFAVSTSQSEQSLAISAEGFTRFFEAIPGLHLGRQAGAFLDSLRGVSLRGNQLRVDCDASFNMGGVPVLLRNLQADMVPDARDRDKMHLRNIRGITAMGMAVTEAELTIKRDDADGILKLAVAVRNPLTPALRRTLAAVYRDAPQNDWIQLKPVPLSKAGRVDSVIDELRRPPADRLCVRMAGAAAYADLPRELLGILGTVTSMTRDGDRLVIDRSQDTSLNLQGLFADLKQRISARVQVSDREIKLDKISGVDFRAPLPPEVRRLLGADNLQGKLKEVSISALDEAGTRRLRLSMDPDSMVQSMEIKVDARFRPVLDRQGRMTVDIIAARCVERDGRREVIRLPISVAFDPRQIENAARTGPDFTVRLAGNDQDYLRVAESILQGANLSDLRDLFRGVRSISKSGDRIVIERAERTSRAIGGVSLDSGKEISFRVTQGEGSLRVAEISGIALTLKPQMPDAVKRYLGVDIGNIPVPITGITVTDMGAGRQRLVVDGSNFLSRVGIFLQDGSPVTEPDGRWKLYAMVQCPQNEEERRLGRPRREMGIILPFNRSNQVDLKPEETAALVAQVAFQNIDPNDPKTWGLGLVAIGSQVASSTIETGRDLGARFQDGLRQIGDGTARARFQDGLRQIGDGTARARFQNGLRRIGGWLGLD